MKDSFSVAVKDQSVLCTTDSLPIRWLNNLIIPNWFTRSYHEVERVSFLFKYILYQDSNIIFKDP